MPDCHHLVFSDQNACTNSTEKMPLSDFEYRHLAGCLIASRQQLPCRLYAFFKLILAGADPGGIVLFRDADAGMTEQDGDLIDGDSGQQHFNGEGVAEHVAVGALACAVGLVQVGNGKESPVGPLPVGNVGFGQAVAGPEEVIWVGV